MSRADVDAFLAQADDVIDNWAGSMDSASWSADGGHEPAEIGGHYYGEDHQRARAEDTRGEGQRLFVGGPWHGQTIIVSGGSEAVQTVGDLPPADPVDDSQPPPWERSGFPVVLYTRRRMAFPPLYVLDVYAVDSLTDEQAAAFLFAHILRDVPGVTTRGH